MGDGVVSTSGAMQRFGRYSEYRDSGVEWLGEIPAHWGVSRNKHLFQEIDDRSPTGGETLLSVSEYYGVKPRSDVVGEGEWITRAESLVGYKLCQPGDLAMNFMLAWKKGLGFSDYSGLVSPSYAVFRPVVNADYRYFHYLLRSLHAVREFRRYSYGIIDSRLRLYPDTFGSLHSPVPPLSEQRAIARSLDREAAKVDQLVAKQQELIRLLQEKRSALIGHAVTKGLDPDVAMRDSGVERLGEIPAHWRVQPLKTLSAMRSGDSITADSIESTGRYPVFGGNGLRGYTGDFTHEGDHVLIGRQGAHCGNVHLARGRFWASEHAVVVSLESPNLIEWCGALLEAMDLNRLSVAAAQPGLAVERLRDSQIPVPPVVEQREILGFLDRETATIAELASKADESIAHLNEYRTALISAAVTGKIDVRHALEPTTTPSPTTPHPNP